MSDTQTSAKAAADTIAQNKATLLSFQREVFNGHDWRVETLAKYMTPDFVDHSTGADAEPGLEGIARRFSAWQAAFGDAHKENIAVLGEGDLVAVLYEIRARHTGEFMGIKPSGKNVVIPGIEILRFQDGKISDYWSIYDYLNTAAEIGARLTMVPKDHDDGAGQYPVQDVYQGVVHRERKKHNVFINLGGPHTNIVEKNKAALLGFQKEVFNGHDWRVETLAKHLTLDFVDHATGPWDEKGLKGVSERFSAWQGAFDDAEEDNIAMVGEDDMLAVLYDLHAEHRGEFLGIPASNNHVVIPGIELLRFRGDKIAEHWGIYDFVSTAEQIGARLVLTPGTPHYRQPPLDSDAVEQAQEAQEGQVGPPSEADKEVLGQAWSAQ
jgi:predicted ester cyclase